VDAIDSGLTSQITESDPADLSSIQDQSGGLPVVKVEKDRSTGSLLAELDQTANQLPIPQDTSVNHIAPPERYK
jgi:hypothetical protein